MYQALRPISEITDRTPRWTAKVLVLQKFSPRQSQKSSHRYQKLLFIDKDETKVQAVIFNEDIRGMEGTLKLQETYFIANAKVETANARYNITEHPYQWVIEKTTVIRHVLHDSLPKELGAPKFTRFNEIPALARSNTLINILGIIIDKADQKTINNKFGTSTVQEFFIINDERIPMMLTLWDDVLATEGNHILTAHETFPIIAITRLTVSSYNGASLSARSTANIMLNPSYPETENLRNWRTRNRAYLTSLTQQRTYFVHKSPNVAIPKNNYSSLANVVMNNTEDKFWAKVSAQITDHEQSFYYIACNNCLRHTRAEHEWAITCNFCHTETIAKARTKFTITLSDETTRLDAVIFGELAENILGYTADQLMRKKEEKEKLNCEAINARLNSERYISQIKKKTITTRYGVEHRYNISTLIQTDDLSIPYNTENEPTGSSSGLSADIAETSNQR